MDQVLMKTSLHDLHVKLGGKMVEFAGYSMPVMYSSILAEAAAVRSEFGLFDVGHMARLSLVGPDAFALLQTVATNDITKLHDAQGLYSILCNETGGSIDDVIIYRETENDYHLVANASNHEKVLRWLQTHKSHDLRIADETELTCMIAVQGPKAIEAVAKVFSEPEVLIASPAFGMTFGTINGVYVMAARSGYTGEDGVEIVGPAERAADVWTTLMDLGGTPCGLAARDTLRVEAGLPLYGHELTEDMSPLCAGLGWAIAKEKPFIGSDEIHRVRTEGPPQKLMGIKIETKRLISPGADVMLNGARIGTVSSGVISPFVGSGIAFAFLEGSYPEGTACQVAIRDKFEDAVICNKRFFKRPKP